METIRYQVLPLSVVLVVAAAALTVRTLGVVVADEGTCGRAIGSRRCVVVD